MRPEEEILHLHRAARVVDAAGTDATPGVILRRGDEIVAAGSPESVGLPHGTVVVEEGDSVLIPALGNAHAHLDLSLLGSFAFEGNFSAWLGMVREFRSSLDDAKAEASLRRGAELSLRGGVVLVGDILGAPLRERGAAILASSGLGGVGFVEVFGVGSSEPAALRIIERMEQELPAELWRRDHAGEGLRIGVQPHAPYSTTDRVVIRALEGGWRISMHVAESPEEVRFCIGGDGPICRLLQEAGAISPETPPKVPGTHPIKWFSELLATHGAGSGRSGSNGVRSRSPSGLAVHLEEVPSELIGRLADSRAVAVFCPRASAYFGRRGMPWRELRAAGVPVALGTDSHCVLDTPDRISTLDEMRLLHRRHGASLEELLPMATTEVARALGAEECTLTLAPGRKPGALAVPCDGNPQCGALTGVAAPRWIFGPARAGGAR